MLKNMMKCKLLKSGLTVPLFTLSLMVIALILFMSSDLFAHGIVDQSNPVGGGSSQISAHMPLGQEFTPSQRTLAAVDVNLGLAMDEGADLLTVNIRKGTITSPILATMSQMVAPCPDTPPYSCGLVHFDFPTPLQVTPGEIYVLELQATNRTHGWIGADGYPGGAAIIQGEVAPAFDYSFQTYAQAAINVSIDIKPGSFPNSINPKSKGKIPVAILTTDSFEATTVDPLSVRFGPGGAVEAHGKGHVEDGDGDGDGALDLVLHFNTRNTGIACGATSVSLTGQTIYGQRIEGADMIQTVGCK
jgi:hypothetical protein